VEQSLREAGYAVKSKEKVRLFRLPGEIVVAVNTISGNIIALSAKKCNLGRLLAVLNDVSRNSVDGDDNLSR